MKKRLFLIGGGGIVLVAVIGVIAWGLLFGDPHVAQGKKLFAYHCAECHGESGEGDGRNAKNLDPRPRDLTDSTEKYFAELNNEEIFEALYRDMKEETDDEEAIFIPPTMPTFKNTLSKEEIWSLVAYIRTLHKNDAPQIVFTEEMDKKRPKFTVVMPENINFSALAMNEGLAEEGRRLMDQVYGCFGCHRIGDKGGEIGPELDRAGFRARPDWLYRWIKNPRAIKPKTKMPVLGITDEHAVAITAYLATLRGGTGGKKETAAADANQ